MGIITKTIPKIDLLSDRVMRGGFLFFCFTKIMVCRDFLREKNVNVMSLFIYFKYGNTKYQCDFMNLPVCKVY